MADLKIQQLDPILQVSTNVWLSANDLFVVKMKARGTALTDEDRKLTWTQLVSSLNLGQYMPTVGGTFTNTVTLNNNIQLLGKQSNGSTVLLAKVGTDNKISYGAVGNSMEFLSVAPPVYFDGTTRFDVVTTKNLPTPGQLSGGAAYTKAETDNALALKLNLAGGNITGTVTLNNNVAIGGKNTGGTSINLAKMGSDNKTYYGAATNNMEIAALNVPVYFDGTSRYDFVTNKNLPTPGQLSGGGAYTKAETDSLKVSKAGDTMTGMLTLPAGQNLRLASDAANSELRLSNESGYALLWRIPHPTLETGKSGEFIGIDKNSNLIFRRDKGLGDGTYNNFQVYHQGYKPTAADVAAVSKSGDIMTGNLTVKPASGNSEVILDSTSGNESLLRMKNAGLDRWSLAANNTAETGSNVGSDLRLRAYNDAGTAALFDVFTVKRSTGETTFTKNVFMSAAQSSASTALTRRDWTLSTFVPQTDVASGGYATMLNKIPKISSSGVMEIASHIDMHAKDSATDYDVRIQVEDDGDFNVSMPSGKNLLLSATAGHLYIKNDYVSNNGTRTFTLGHGGSDVFLKNSVSNQYIRLKDDGTLDYTNRKIYHEGFKPTAQDVGAYSYSESEALYARSGVNSDITALNGLTGALKVGANAVNALEVTTLQQVQAMTSGTAGAVVGVVGGFIGAVMWINCANRSKIPAGWVAADGQLLNRVDYPDLWAAVNSGAFASVTDAQWLNGPGGGIPVGQYRGRYSTGSTTANFRLPDLNGAQNNSIRAVFLRGDANGLSGTTIGGIGEVLASAAPNIYGEVSFATKDAYTRAFHNPSGAFSAYSKVDDARALPTTNEPVMLDRHTTTEFNASRSDAAYGRVNANGTTPANEVRPNSVTGIWIIRASNSYAAANTEFNVYNGAATAPANNAVVTGGAVRSLYQVAGATRLLGQMYAYTKWGSDERVVIDATSYTSAGAVNKSAQFYFETSGALNAPNVVSGSGLQAFGDGANRKIEAKAGTTNGWYAGSLSAAYAILYSDGTSQPGLYVKGKNTAAAGYEQTLLASSARNRLVWSCEGTSFFKPGVLSDSFGAQWINAPFKAEAVGAVQGSSQFQPLCSIIGGTAGYGYNGSASFGKYTTGAATFGFPAIARGLSDVDAGGGMANNAAWVFGNVSGNSGGISTPTGDIVPGGSDRRLKHGIVDSQQGAPERIAKLRAREFEWNETNKKARGFIAQEAQEVDELYAYESQNEDKTLNLDDRAIMADLVATVQNLLLRVSELEAKLAAK